MRKLKTILCVAIVFAIALILPDEVFADSPISVYTNAISNIWTKEMNYLDNGTTSAHTHWFEANINIGSFSISGQTAFCGNHHKNSPDTSNYGTAYLYTPDTDGYDAKVAAILYYGYAGPGMAVSWSNNGYYATTYLLFKTLQNESIVSGMITALGSDGSTLQSHLNNQDAPDDFAYVLWYPDDSSLQVIGFAAGTVPKAGNLTVIKQDQYGNRVEGAQYVINGQTYTTNSNGELNIEGLTAGTYTVQEVYVPSPLILDSSVKTIEITAGNTTTVTFTNTYQRGSVTLTKYDSDNKGSTKGNATIEGAVFSLYAGDNIYEGKTLVYSKDQLIRSGITTASDGTTETITDLPVGTYYYVETQASAGFNINTDKIEVTVSYAGQNASVAASGSNVAPEKPKYFNFEIYKALGETDYDAEIALEGARFKLTLTTDESQVYYTSTSGSNGRCTVSGIPYGEYTVEECVVPDGAYKIEKFTVFIGKDENGNDVEDGYTYSYTSSDTSSTYSKKVDKSKTMKIAVTKEITLADGEATDATVQGAYFTVYTDAEGTIPYVDKNGNTVVIGPTDSTGYAISDEMRTGTYYLKETTFPTGIDPDSKLPDEDVTYRDKVYTVEYDNTTQGDDTVTVPITIQNVPARNDIIVYKNIEVTSDTEQSILDKCEFTATLLSSIGTDHEYSVKCTAPTDENGYCIIEDLPYGKYVIEETTVSPISLKCANFYIFVEQDRKVKTSPYEPKDAYQWDSTTLGETTSTTKTYAASYNWLDADNNIVDIAKVMQIKIRKVDYDGYYGGEAVDYTQGDATLKGAKYQVYRYNPETDQYEILYRVDETTGKTTTEKYIITVDHQDSSGYWCAETDDLLVGKYMVKEVVKSTEVGNDGVTYRYSYAEGYLVDDEEYYFEVKPDEQSYRVSYHTAISKEKVIRGSIEVIKYDDDVYSSDEAASEGAVLRLTLDSNPSIYYEVEIDQYGYGNFLDTNDDIHTTSVKTCYGYAYYPYTIPYGQYTITEVEASDSGKNTSFYVQPESVTVKKNTQQEYRIEADEPTPAYLKIVKYDADTGEEVVLSGARFKIWSVDDDDWVTFKTYPDFADITEIESNDEGYVITPQQLQPGTYVIYEVEAPDGYYLEDSLRVPEDEAYLGNVDYGGQEVVVDKRATGLADDAVYPEGGYTGDLYIQVDIYDRPLKVQLEMYKTGEVLTTSTESGTIYGSKYTPVWEERGLEGVTYNIVAAEDIMSPDGRITYVKEGTVVDTITTGEDGYATTDELYPGTYSIVEIDTPDGYLIDDNIENVTLTNENEYERVKLHKKELGDIRQKLELTFEKIFEEIQYSTTQKLEQKAVFGVYTNEDIYNYKGQRVISKDSLVDVITVTENNSYATSTIDLPEGTYYVMELEVSYPYITSDEVQYFTLKYTSDKTQEFVVVEGEDVENTYKSAPLILLKLSTTSTDADHVLSLSGSELTEESVSNLDNLSKEITEAVKNLTADETLTYITDLLEKISGSTELTEDEKEEETNKILTVSGVTYQVFVNEECTQPLYKLNEETGEYTDTVTITTDLTGAGIIYGIPYGTYYVKEVSAPAGYTLSSEAVQIFVNETTGIPKVFQITYDDSTIGKVITKTDIFTGDVVPNCTFEITDEKGTLLVHSITDDEGNAYVPVDLFEDGKTYYYTEIDAPDIYELNTDSHAFVAQIDEETGDWTAEPIEVENIRKTSTVTLIKLDLVDSTPIPNCKFELRSLETDFVVEGVTDENGIYVFENIPYGEYTYTELEAPEEYQIDTTPHEITIDAEEITIQVTNQLVDTSDIAVIALVFVSVLSIAGIVIVTSKNRKKSSII